MPVVTIMNPQGVSVARTVTDHLFTQAPGTKLCTCGNPRGFHTMREAAAPNVVGKVVVDQEPAA